MVLLPQGKGSKNLIITRKYSVYKAFRASKYFNKILIENFAYIPICFVNFWIAPLPPCRIPPAFLPVFPAFSGLWNVGGDSSYLSYLPVFPQIFLGGREIAP